MYCKQVGDAIPSVEVMEGTPKDKVDVAKLFEGKRGILFAVPGAFTPGCSKVRYCYCGFSIFCEPSLSNACYHLMFYIWFLSIKATNMSELLSRIFLNPPTYTNVCTNLSWLVSFHLGDNRSFDWREQKHQIVSLFCASEFAENGKLQ